MRAGQPPEGVQAVVDGVRPVVDSLVVDDVEADDPHPRRRITVFVGLHPGAVDPCHGFLPPDPKGGHHSLRDLPAEVDCPTVGRARELSMGAQNRLVDKVFNRTRLATHARRTPDRDQPLNVPPH
jgi:hypothetical protein